VKVNPVDCGTLDSPRRFGHDFPRVLIAGLPARSDAGRREADILGVVVAVDRSTLHRADGGGP
jgi:hypothetical protein